MPGTRDYYLDIPGLEEDASPNQLESAAVTGRKWIGVQFECCGAYQRIYRNRDGSAYNGHCPRCGAPVRVRIGPDGTGARMFRAR